MYKKEENFLGIIKNSFKAPSDKFVSPNEPPINFLILKSSRQYKKK